MPKHNEVVVDKSHADAPEREHALVAIREAFDAAVRQIENVMREFRGQVKHHAEASHGRVKNLLAGEDYGFIETADGREIYFHRNAVLDAAFDRLKVGSEVAFAEEEGVKGPQASTVRVIGGGIAGPSRQSHSKRGVEPFELHGWYRFPTECGRQNL